jgi:hypothetical protein
MARYFAHHNHNQMSNKFGVTPEFQLKFQKTFYFYIDYKEERLYYQGDELGMVNPRLIR